jgi:hypothetical protein
VGDLPLVVLASEPELAAAARNAPLLVWVAGLVTFVGDGRRVTERGNLTVADGKVLVDWLGTGDEVDHVVGDTVFRTRSSTQLVSVDLAYRVALASQFLVGVGRTKVAASPEAWLLRDEPLNAAFRLFLALLEVGPTQHRYGGDTYGWWWFADDLDAMLLQLLVELYGAPRRVPVEVIGEGFWRELLAGYELEDVEPKKLEYLHDRVITAVRRACARLRDAGVLQLTGVVEEPTEHGTTNETGGEVALSPLGVWAVHRVLSEVTDSFTGPPGLP